MNPTNLPIRSIVLCFFVISIPVIYMNDQSEIRWLPRVLGLLAVVLSAVRLQLRLPHPSILALCAIFIWFSYSAFASGDATLSDSFQVTAQFAVLAAVLSLTLAQRTQILAVMLGLTISVIIVAVLSQGELTSARQVLETGDARALDKGRTAGIFQNANLFGTYATQCIIAALAVWFVTKRLLLLSFVAVVCGGYLAMYSGSRKAILAIPLVLLTAAWQALAPPERAAGIRVLFYRLGIFRHLPVGAVWLAPLVLMLLGAAAYAWVAKNPFADRFSVGEDSASVRAALLVAAWDKWLDRPLFGWGYHGFERVISSGDYTHCTPAEMFVNGGLLCGTLYFVFWAALIRSLWRCFRCERSPQDKTLLVWVGTLVIVLLVFSLFTVLFEETLFLVLIGPICGFLQSKELEPLRCNRRPNTPAPTVGRQTAQDAHAMVAKGSR